VSGDCPFCRLIAAGEYDVRCPDAVSFEPLNPVTPGHRLVVPVVHVTDALEDPEITGRTMDYAATLAILYDAAPCNLITSVGAAATQSVYHLHIHIVPRREGDGLALPWTGPRDLPGAAAN
jgi:histidine triad (HIT) family protein